MPRREDHRPPPLAEFFIGVLTGLAYEHLGCRYDVLFKVNAKGNFVVAIVWGNDANLRHKPRCEDAIPPRLPPPKDS